MQHSMKNMTLFPYQFICLCWKIALDIALVDLTLSLDTERVTAMVLQDVPLRFCVPSENDVTWWGFCSTMLSGNFVLRSL